MSPQVIMSLVVLLAAIGAFMLTRTPPPEVTEFELPMIEQAQHVTEEVRLITYDQFGLEVPVRVSLEVPTTDVGRLGAIVDALVLRLGEQGDWPAGLETPTVHLVESTAGSTAVLDLAPPAGLGLDPETEERLYRAFEETLLASGVRNMRFLLNGEPQGVFLQSVRVPVSLD